LDFIERLIGFICVIVATFTVIQVQETYFFYRSHDLECSQGDFKIALDWLKLEIFLFYMCIISNVFFIVTCDFFLDNSGLLQSEKKENKVDFLLSYQLINGLY
jgi:hypothetical protein